VAATDPLISNVSDTARWVATYRAVESARPDALFHDPLADRLAGDRGRAIVAAAPRMIRNGWWLVARTKVIERHHRGDRRRLRQGSELGCRS